MAKNKHTSAHTKDFGQERTFEAKRLKSNVDNTPPKPSPGQHNAEGRPPQIKK